MSTTFKEKFTYSNTILIIHTYSNFSFTYFFFLILWLVSKHLWFVSQVKLNQIHLSLSPFLSSQKTDRSCSRSRCTMNIAVPFQSKTDCKCKKKKEKKKKELADPAPLHESRSRLRLKPRSLP